MSSTEAFKLRVLIKLVRGRDEKWMTALGLSFRINDFVESIIGWAGCQWVEPRLLPLQEPMGSGEAQMGGGRECLTPVSINSVFNRGGNGTVTNRLQCTCHRRLCRCARIHITFPLCLFLSAFLYLYILLLYPPFNISPFCFYYPSPLSTFLQFIFHTS